MSSPIRACSICGESYWSIGPGGRTLQSCPLCAAAAFTEPGPALSSGGAGLAPEPRPQVCELSAAVTAPQLGFNCPSCFAVLFIRNPSDYDGQAAPCPHCRMLIFAPRMAPVSPFVLVAPSPAALPQLCESSQAVHQDEDRSGKWKPFRRHDYGSPGRMSVA